MALEVDVLSRIDLTSDSLKPNMEPISLTASLLTLVAAITATIKTTTTIFREIHDASHELAALGIRLQLLQAELEALSYLTTADLDKVLPDALKSCLLSSLHLGHESLEDILKICKKGCDRTGLRGRLKWSLIEQSAVANHLKRVKSFELSLTFLLQSVIM
jgi:hypothetical protein